MRKFRFRLQTVSSLREREEELCQLAFAQALRKRSEVAEKLATARNAELRVHEYVRSGSLSARDLAHVSRYAELHRQRIVDLRVAVADADASVEAARRRLVVARGAREALDHLRERDLAAHMREQQAIENRELDELGTMRAARRRRAETHTRRVLSGSAA